MTTTITCTGCGRIAQSYEHLGIKYDGLIAVQGELLCKVCTNSYLDNSSIDILFVNPANGDSAVLSTKDLLVYAPSTGKRWR